MAGSGCLILFAVPYQSAKCQHITGAARFRHLHCDYCHLPLRMLAETSFYTDKIQSNLPSATVSNTSCHIFLSFFTLYSSLLHSTVISVVYVRSGM